jgi:pimeloyl-ACP methyl ester carboxylesterase
MNPSTTTIGATVKPHAGRRKRGAGFWTWRILLGLLVLLVALPAAGAIYQAVATVRDKAAYPAPGQLVDVGGFKLHINCRGASRAGSATVVAESGAGGTSLDWSLVQADLAQTTRVCSYDRAGFGWSAAAPSPRTSQQIVTELYALLHNAGIPAPYVLVGHSVGGLHVQLYASQYPDDVAGLVLLDPTPAAYLARLTAEERRAAGPPTVLLRTLQFVHPFGLLRLLDFGPWKTGMPLERMAPDLQRAVKAVSFQPGFVTALNAEGMAVETNLAQAVVAKPFRADIPLIVLVRGLVIGPVDQDAGGKAANAALAQRGTNGRVVVAETSGHYIQFERPDLVIAAVRDVVEAARTGQPLTR